ncbi:hypothetical protein [Alteromonas lipotrueae]|uniref:hypothetical protein n=1 Tax=Alteromonas lipotrueae TaxID=2803814 RepID=UPI001C4398F7|nr:hypothetical protein [Alteromonas lipotrueae]
MIQILTAIAPILRDLVNNLTSGTKKAAQGVSTALDGRVGLALIGMWCYPFISVFIPYLQAYTMRGFVEVRQMPDWYIDFIMVLSGALVGVAGYRRRQ